MSNVKQRKTHLDILRIMACALVVFNHTEGYLLFEVTSGLPQLLCMICTMFTRVNVPIFFMITGALLLRRSDNVMDVMRHRVVRFAALIVLFEGLLFCAYAVRALIQGAPYEFTIARFVAGVLAKDLDGTGSYWFLYAYLGLLLALPYMQRIARGITCNEIRLLLALHAFVFSILPAINVSLSYVRLDHLVLTDDFAMPFALAGAFFYPLMGYYVDVRVDVSGLERSHIIKLALALVISIALSCGFTYLEAGAAGTFTQGSVLMFDYVAAIAIFVLVKCAALMLDTRISAETKRRLAQMASLTLGVYLLDPFLKGPVYPVYANVVGRVLSIMPLSLGWVVVSMALGGTLTYLLRKMPIAGRLL